MSRKVKMKLGKTVVASALLVGVLAFSAGCGSGGSDEEQVIIYSNADEEAVEVMETTLNDNGYEGQYIIQSFGTSELGGKLLAEGSDIEADVVTMSSYYLDSAQTENEMFSEKTYETAAALEETPNFYSTILANQGALFVNTELMEEYDLPMPESIKDLADPVYEGYISVTDITGSSTAWLMIQALVDTYGEEEAQTILEGIYKNAGAHLESSGSGPIKKVRAGEVAVGFGLRHQAVADKADGLPIDYIDPTEGNYTLTEAIATVDKGDDTNPLAMEMAGVIVNEGRAGMLEYYPTAAYEGETVDEANMATYPMVFPEALTVELLKTHEELSEAAK